MTSCIVKLYVVATTLFLAPLPASPAGAQSTDTTSTKTVSDTLKKNPTQPTDTTTVKKKPKRPATLAPVKITAHRRNKVRRQDLRDDVGNIESWLYTNDNMGVLTVPGADGNPDGFSVLGLSSDQNSITLNGMDAPMGTLPNGMMTTTRITTSPYDVSQGGFSGAQMAMNIIPASNFVSSSTGFGRHSPSLQWLDDASARSGQKYSNTDFSWSRSAPIIEDKLFWNIGASLGRRSSDLFALRNSDPLTLERAGFSPDSVERALELLQLNSIPYATRAVPDDRITDKGSVALYIHTDQEKDATAALTVNSSWNTQRGSSLSASAVPAHGGEIKSRYTGVNLALSRYLFGTMLGDWRTSFSVNSNKSVPYVTLPDGRVNVASVLNDGTREFGVMQFGGNSAFPSNSSSATFQSDASLVWNSLGGAHRRKLALSIKVNKDESEQTFNRYGTFVYNSLEDLEAGIPAYYFRTIGTNDRSLRTMSGAVSLGDTWKYSQRLRITSGIRLEGNRFGNRPQNNPLIEQAFDVRNDYVPNKVHLSPRIGFTWNYGMPKTVPGAKTQPSVTMQNRVRALSGGIGEYRNSLSTGLINSALSFTGLPNGLQQLQCVGAAVPVPDWEAYLDDPENIPEECADGSSAVQFANANPNVYLIDRNYDASRSWRANLGWGVSLSNWLILALQGTTSLNLNQTGFVDINMSRTPVFTLGNENNRPVFADPSVIVPATGYISPNASRANSSFNRVMSQTADLRSLTHQLNLSIYPMLFGERRNLFWSVRYVYMHANDQSRGFSGTTAGDPMTAEWGRSSMATRHQIVLGVSRSFFKSIYISLNGQFRSGQPYTPRVSGDINGDGMSNDRPFVFDSVAHLNKCLAKQVGRIAAKNSCEGPWTFALNASMNGRYKLPGGTWLNVNFINPLAGLDMALHGRNNMRGWGQRGTPDPTLMTVRGFDPGTRQYIYEINPRFGDTRINRSVVRTPFQIAFNVTKPIGPSYEKQMVGKTIKYRESGKYNPVQLRAMLKKNLVGNWTDPFVAVKRMRDSLHVTDEQMAVIDSLHKGYTAEVDSLWAPVIEEYATLSKNISDAAIKHLREARKVFVFTRVRWGQKMVKVLTPEQFEQLPELTRNAVDPLRAEDLQYKII